jgi:hypothetical protein
MRTKINMCDFVRGRCESVKRSDKFVADWLTTKRNPCLVCNMDKSMCRYYKELVDKGLLIEEREATLKSLRTIRLTFSAPSTSS